jgi:hypothetical protein
MREIEELGWKEAVDASISQETLAADFMKK